MEATLELDLRTPLDWRVLRAARLYALLDSPDAFTSSYSRESTWEEPEWQQLLNGATWIVARDNQHIIGLAKSTGEPERPACRHIESAWVAPTHRQRGVLGALLQALIEMERQMGVTDFLLWVLENNHVAQRAYHALGFELTGERQFLPAFGQFERRLRLVVSSSQSLTGLGRRLGLDRGGAKFSASPRVQLQEVHGIASSSHIVDIAGKRLPFLKIVLPGIDEVHAVVRSNDVIKLILGCRKRNERRGKATVVPIFCDYDAEPGNDLR